MNILHFLQTVDRRFLYAMLLIAVCLPFFLSFTPPVNVSPSTQKMYDAIEELPENSFVLFGVDWGAGTRGENRAQTEALMHHVMRKKLRFAIMAIGEPQARELTQNIALRLQEKYGYKEGENWVNFGYKVDPDNFLKSFVQDIPGSVLSDIHGRRLADLPVMQGVKTANDIAFLIDVAPSSAYESYIQYVQGAYNLKMGLACTSVMGPEAFNRLDSKQIVGLVVGLSGATEYETLIKIPGKATQASNSSAFAHLLIIAFILLGNVAMVMERRQRARVEAGGY